MKEKILALLLAVTAFSSITTIGAGLRGLVQRPTVDSFAALATVSAALQNAAYLFGAKTFAPDTVTLFAPVAALPMLLLMAIWLMVNPGGRKKKRKKTTGNKSGKKAQKGKEEP